MTRPIRSIDAETVRHVARYAGLPLSEDRVEQNVQFLNAIALTEVVSWEAEKLGFWFEDGCFSFVRPAVVHRIPWEDSPVPHKLRVAASEGAN